MPEALVHQAVAGRGVAMVVSLVLLVLPQYLQEHLLLTIAQILGPLAHSEGMGALILPPTAAAAAGLLVTVLLVPAVVLIRAPEVLEAEEETAPFFSL